MILTKQYIPGGTIFIIMYIRCALCDTDAICTLDTYGYQGADMALERAGWLHKDGVAWQCPLHNDLGGTNGGLDSGEVSR